MEHVEKRQLLLTGHRTEYVAGSHGPNLPEYGRAGDGGQASDVLVRHMPASWSEGSWLLGVWIVATGVNRLHGGTWECQTSWWCELRAISGDLCAGRTVRRLRERQVLLQAVCGSPGTAGICTFPSLRKDTSACLHTFPYSAVQIKTSDL